MTGNIELGRVLREDGVAGTVGHELTDEVVATAALRFATLIREEGARAVALGRDCRLSSPHLHAVVTPALLAAGLEIVDLGLCPRPLLCSTILREDLQGGVYLGGGVGAPALNGLVLYAGASLLRAVSGERLGHASGEPWRGPPGRRRGATSRAGFIEDLEAAAPSGGGPGVVVDCGHGTVGSVLLPLLRRAGVVVHERAAETDGRFPTRPADPQDPRVLGELGLLVRQRSAALGIAFDPEGVRIAVVDERGEPIWPDHLLLLLAGALAATTGPAVVLVDPRSSPSVLEGIAAQGRLAVASSAGPAALRAGVRSRGALLGGDLEGHLVFGGEGGGYEDGLAAALRLIALRQGAPLSMRVAELGADRAGAPALVPCPAALQGGVLSRIADRAGSRGRRVGGVVRLELERGWGVVWLHPTRPAVVLRVGGADPTHLDALRAQLEGEVQAARREAGASG